MKEEELISVIVPVYNVEMYLAACIDSILSQSYKNIEIIIINDGSTDFSLKIAETYQENEDRVTVYSYENEGLSEARNRGLKVATGDYVTFVDSDDILLPGALEMMLSTLKTQHADLVEGKIVRGKIHNDIPVPSIIKKFSFSAKEAIADVLYQNKLLPSVCGKLFRKDLFENLKFEKGLLYEDLNIFYLILGRCNKVVWIDYPVYFYRDTEGSIINTWKPQRLDVLKITENIEKYISEKYPDILPAAKDRRLSANFNMFALCSINGDHENATLCWQHIKTNRRMAFFNKNIRLKNKTGVLLSYLGKDIFRFISRRVYK